MVVYTYSKARQSFAALLDKLAKEGEVRITRKDGQRPLIRPVMPADSPLDLEGVDSGLTTGEILKSIAESRRL